MHKPCIVLAKFCIKIGVRVCIVYFDLESITMLSFQVNSLYLHSFHIIETYLIQEKNSCMAGDALVE